MFSPCFNYQVALWLDATLAPQRWTQTEPKAAVQLDAGGLLLGDSEGSMSMGSEKQKHVGPKALKKRERRTPGCWDDYLWRTLDMILDCVFVDGNSEK